MTAVEAWQDAVRRNRLPAAIPVRHPDGTTGLLTGSAEVDPECTSLAFSLDMFDRAEMAIQVCMMTAEVAKSQTILRPVS